jgi:hypothetical protein
MATTTHTTAFANRSLFRNESVAIAALFLRNSDWKTVQQLVLSNNLLQSRTLSNAERLCRELISRVKTLRPAELALLVNGTALEQGYILWVAVCRRYPLIAKFAGEVLRERYISLKPEVRHEEFDSFFNKLSDLHANLEAFEPATRSKRRQILFKLLRETELIDANHRIIPARLTGRLVDAVSETEPTALTWFPVFESDLKYLSR